MNKIGLHVTAGTRLPLRGPNGTPAIVKLHDCSVAYKRQVRQEVGPDCLIVVRWFEAAQPLTAPEEEAEHWVARHYADLRAMAHDDPNVIFEGYNEIPDAQAPAFARFELKRLQLLHAAGLRAGVGSWSVGTPHWPVWQIYKPALDAMRPADVVCLHEYWADGEDLGRDWLCGRFARPEVRPYLAGKLVAITECGRDVVDGRGARGWQKTCDAGTFLQELGRYHAILAAHPNVIGATVFDDGSPDPQWHPYSPAPVWGQVVAAYTPAQPVTPPKEDSMALGPDPSVPYYHSPRHGYAPAWLILHDTEGPASAALAWWRDPANAGRSSAHWLVKTRGEVVACVPERYAAHHAGGGTWPGIPAGGVGGTSIINLVSIGIELEYPQAPAAPAWPAPQLDSAVALARRIVAQYAIPRDHVLRHSDVAPATRSDPRAFDWSGFLARVYGPDRASLERAIGEALQGSIVPLNPNAAFERAGAARGLLPAGPEVDVEHGGVTYRAQAYRSPGARQWQEIVYCAVGEWSDLTWFRRRN